MQDESHSHTWYSIPDPLSLPPPIKMEEALNTSPRVSQKRTRFSLYNWVLREFLLSPPGNQKGRGIAFPHLILNSGPACNTTRTRSSPINSLTTPYCWLYSCFVFKPMTITFIPSRTITPLVALSPPSTFPPLPRSISPPNANPFKTCSPVSHGLQQ